MRLENLKNYIPRSEIKKLYTAIIVEAYKEQTKYVDQQKQKLLDGIKDYKVKLSNARDLLATGQIEASDYRDMKSDYGAVIS